jgi:hypothetical protein
MAKNVRASALVSMRASGKDRWPLGLKKYHQFPVLVGTLMPFVSSPFSVGSAYLQFPSANGMETGGNIER